MTDSNPQFSPTDTGMDRPRPTEDTYVLGQYAELGLGKAPSLAEIEPFALEMMRGRKILEGLGLVLGRRVNASDRSDPDVGTITMLAVQNPDLAFSMLLVKLTADELKAEKPS